MYSYICSGRGPTDSMLYGPVHDADDDDALVMLQSYLLCLVNGIDQTEPQHSICTHIYCFGWVARRGECVGGFGADVNLYLSRAPMDGTRPWCLKHECTICNLGCTLCATSSEMYIMVCVCMYIQLLHNHNTQFVKYLQIYQIRINSIDFNWTLQVDSIGESVGRLGVGAPQIEHSAHQYLFDTPSRMYCHLYIILLYVALRAEHDVCECVH